MSSSKRWPTGRVTGPAERACLLPGEGALLVSVPAGVSPSQAALAASVVAELFAVACPGGGGVVKLAAAVLTPAVAESSGFAAWFADFAGKAVARGDCASVEVGSSSEDSCVH